MPDGVTMDTLIKVLQQLDFAFVEISGGGYDPRSQKAPWRQGEEDFYYKDAFEKLK